MKSPTGLQLSKKDNQEKLIKKIIGCKSSALLSEHLNTFKLVSLKRELIRIYKLMDMLDAVETQIVDRMDKEYIKADTLIKLGEYLTISIDRSNRLLSEINTVAEEAEIAKSAVAIPTYSDALSIESRTSVKIAVTAILSMIKELPEDQASTILSKEYSVKGVDSHTIDLDADLDSLDKECIKID